MSDPRENDSETDTGANATGSQTDDAHPDWALVDSGQSDDIENSLTGQGVSDRETVDDIHGDDSGQAGADGTAV